MGDDGGGTLRLKRCWPGSKIFSRNPETVSARLKMRGSAENPDAARKLGNLVTAIVSGWKVSFPVII
ncbi:MAG: hypothetical protein R3D66_01685 [Alphaproteobacteria bacterium]